MCPDTNVLDDIIFSFNKNATLEKDQDLVVGFSLGWQSISFEDQHEKISKILSLIDNNRSVSKMSKQLNLTITELEAFLEYFFELGLLVMQTPISLSWGLYSPHVLNVARSNRHAMLKARAMPITLTVKPQYLLNALIQSYFLIDSAREHIAIAFENAERSHCPNLEALEDFFKRRILAWKLIISRPQRSSDQSGKITTFPCNSKYYFFLKRNCAKRLYLLLLLYNSKRKPY